MPLFGAVLLLIVLGAMGDMQKDGESDKDYCMRIAKTTSTKDIRATCLQYLQPVTETHEIQGATEADCTNIHPVLYKEAREACDKYNASLLKIIQ